MHREDTERVKSQRKCLKLKMWTCFHSPHPAGDTRPWGQGMPPLLQTHGNTEALNLRGGANRVRSRRQTVPQGRDGRWAEDRTPAKYEAQVCT